MEKGRFDDAARRFATVDPRRSQLLEKAARLRAKGDSLALARWLNSHAGELGHGIDRGEIRGISAFYKPGTPEGKRLEGALKRGDERWLSLAYYVEWLEGHETAPNALGVLKEAGATHNRALNWGTYAETFWFTYAPKTPLVARLRQRGR